MGKHLVSCVKCGRQFDANQKGTGYYPKSRRYECPDCVERQKQAQKEASKAAKADERERNTGMRQSKPAMIVKIAVGVLVAACSIPLAAQGNIIAFLCGLCIGVALVAWGVVPYLKSKQ